MRDIEAGLRLQRRVELTAEGIAEFATAAGDHNPIHHDEAYASNTRYGGVLASGAQTTSLLMGLAATELSQGIEMVGLEFAFRLRAPVRVPQHVTVEWLVVDVRDAPRLGGRIVDLRGRILTEAGKTAVGAKGKVLVAEKL